MVIMGMDKSSKDMFLKQLTCNGSKAGRVSPWKKVCSCCSCEIIEKYYTVNQKYLCVSCYGSEYQCSRCNKLIDDSFYTIEGEKVCLICYFTCAACSCRINGEHHIADDKVFCTVCYTKPRCMVCNKISNFDLIELDLNLYVCKQCRPLVVADEKDLSRALLEAYRWIKNVYGFVASGIKIKKIDLVGKGKLAREHRGGYLNPFRIAGDAAWNGKIQIIKNSLLESAVGIIVHEMAHLWQFENWDKYSEMEKYKIEGFAVWLEFKIQWARGASKEIKVLFNHNDPVYGAGFRYVLDIEKSGVPLEDIFYGRI